MGLGADKVAPNPEAKEEGQVITKIITKIVEPIVVSQRKLYHTNPEKVLQFGLILLFLILTFIGELFSNLPIAWYTVFGALVLGHFGIFSEIKKYLKKKKKLKK